MKRGYNHVIMDTTLLFRQISSKTEPDNSVDEPRTKPLEKVLNVRSIYTSKPANSKFCIQFYSKLRNGCSTMCTNSLNHVSIILRYFVSS